MRKVVSALSNITIKVINSVDQIVDTHETTTLDETGCKLTKTNIDADENLKYQPLCNINKLKTTKISALLIRWSEVRIPSGTPDGTR